MARWRATGSSRGPVPPDLVREVIEARQSLRTFEVNAAVLRAADRLTGLLLDELA